MRCRAVFSSVVATGLTLAFVPFGCASSIETPRFYQVATRDELVVPRITAERLQECLETYQDQFSSGNIRVRYRVNVDKLGRVLSVETNDIPKSAPEFAACTRVSLREMTVPDQALRQWPGQSVGSTNGQTQAARGAMGDVLVLGAEVDLAELALTAGGMTLLLTISIVLAVSAVSDIVDVVAEDQENKRRCNEKRNDCLDTHRSGRLGPVHGSSRCESCFNACRGLKGEWPSHVFLDGKFRSCK